MGSTVRSSFQHSLMTLTLCAAVLLGLFVDQCTCTDYVLGGSAGWTDNGNIDYTTQMAEVKFVAGDTLVFNNYDNYTHDYQQVYSQQEYDSCTANNGSAAPTTLDVNSSSTLMLPDPAYLVWIFDSVYCFKGLKVEFTVLNTDGTSVAAPSPDIAPSLNAPPDSSYTAAPPPPPASGTTSGASLQRGLEWVTLAILATACYLATSAMQPSLQIRN